MLGKIKPVISYSYKNWTFQCPNWVPRGQRDGSLQPYSRLSRPEPLHFFQVAPQLYSRGWADPVPDPLLLRKSGSAGNRTRTSGSAVWKSDHKTTEAVIVYPMWNGTMWQRVGVRVRRIQVWRPTRSATNTRRFNTANTRSSPLDTARTQLLFPPLSSNHFCNTELCKSTLSYPLVSFLIFQTGYVRNVEWRLIVTSISLPYSKFQTCCIPLSSRHCVMNPVRFCAII
jgi:hypothetical protein